MGTMTINVNDNIEERFRIVVAREKGLGKGRLGSAVEEALDSWIKNKEQEDVAKRQLELMKKGFRLGKYTFNRDDLHGREY